MRSCDVAKRVLILSSKGYEANYFVCSHYSTAVIDNFYKHRLSQLRKNIPSFNKERNLSKHFRLERKKKKMPINAAFRSSKHNECYVFVNDKYVLLSYVPGTNTEKILEGPKLIREGFPALVNTPFENGIGCAFDTDNNEAYIFLGGDCALIDYAPHSTNARLLIGPVPIGAMFPFLKGTVFDYGIDAAIRSSKSNEVYLFKGDQYARINYATRHILNTTSIRNGFSSLVGTIFENGLDSAFAIHIKDEAYIFKGDYYARFYFAPCATNDRIIGRVQRIVDYWVTLRDLLASSENPWGPGQDVGTNN